jgi:CsoR family transcriptional regulator, copper-sensing transcriptional repressor
MQEHRKKILNRLRRIEGQIKGLEKMVEREAPCVEVLTQLSAATSAMKQTGNAIIQEYMKQCINETVQDPDKSLEEFKKVLARYIAM